LGLPGRLTGMVAESQMVVAEKGVEQVAEAGEELEAPSASALDEVPLEEVESAAQKEQTLTSAEEASSEAATAPGPGSVTRGRGTWALAVAGVVLMAGSTIVEIATQDLVSRTGGAVMFAALTATTATLGWAASISNFVFVGGVSLIGAAMGRGEDLKAGRLARLIVLVALFIGCVGTGLLLALEKHVLALFGHRMVAEQAHSVFRCQASFFSLALVLLALNGVMFGFLYVHVVIACIAVGSAIGLSLVYPLFLATDLGLLAFPISTSIGATVSIALILAYLLRGHRRRRFGLHMGVSGISMADVRELGSSIGFLAFRAFVQETPYMMSVVLTIRISPVHGAVFQFLVSQSGLVDRIVSAFAMGVTFMGARLWGAKYHSAFWNLLYAFVMFLCTPVATVVCMIELFRGQDSLANTFASHSEKAYFQAVMTRSTYTFYLFFILVRAYYNIFEQAMLALHEFKMLALVQAVSFVVYLCFAMTAYALKDLSLFMLCSDVFLGCRVLGCALVLWRRLREHTWQKYVKGSLTDPDFALKMTIDDPDVARVFGGRTPSAAKGAEAPEFADV